jgi:CRISPR-associated protein Csm3
MTIYKKKIRLQLIVQTGLHIGSGDDKVQIGGVDSAIVKDPITKLPYIPGSSLKGKIRCLLETESRNFPDGELDEKLNTYFGINVPYKKKMDALNAERKNNNQEPIDYETPTRILFRDLTLCENYITKDDNGNEITKNFKKDFLEGKITTEFKSEISIDRKKGTVTTAGPRTIERIPPQIVFEGDVLIRYFDDNELEEIEKTLIEGLNLLENDYLGGSGSRGYGAVKCKLLNENKQE